MGIIHSWLDFFGLEHAHLFAVLVSVPFGTFFTQAAKKAGHYGGRYAFLTAIVATAIPCYILAPPLGIGFDWVAFWLALLTGFASTRLYRLTRWLIGRRWPEVAEAMGDD